VIEVVDRPLQHEEGIVLPLAVARDFLYRPGDERLVVPLDLRQRTDGDAIPEGLARSAEPPAEPADKPDVLGGRPAVARRA
jgi:hypothetical protein